MIPDETDLFFSLKDFAHRTLWKEGDPVWGALHQLKNYVDIWAHKIEVKVPSGVHLERPELITIGTGTVIEPGVFIQGPCIIGKNCVIRHGAYIREYSVFGDGCAVGHSAETKHSIFFDACAVTHFVYVGDSIIGNLVNIGAGVKCANLRLDRKEICIDKIKTGLKKLGAILGDRVQIGCNCVLNPGTLIGRESICHPLVNISGYVPPRSIVKVSRSFRIEPQQEAKAILEQMGGRT